MRLIVFLLLGFAEQHQTDEAISCSKCAYEMAEHRYELDPK